MVRSFNSSSLVFVFSIMMASCAGVDDKAQDFLVPAETLGLQKFSAWKHETAKSGAAVENKAVQELLLQADTLIDRNQMDQASDKLDRLLRIEPASAQAWSRLAWIALKNNMPGRTQQMAQRSNGYAAGDNKLKALNWSFIREAAQLTGDEATITQAENMINLLGGL